MIEPLIRPMITPSAMAAMKASGSGIPAAMRYAASMPAAAITEPIDRSKPPEMMTMVSPTAAMPTMEMARPMLSRLVASKK